MSLPTIPPTPVRPSLAALSDRVAAARFRDETFPATSWTEPSMVLLNLGGATSLTLAAITELLAPILRGLASRSYGNLAVGIVSEDQPVTLWLESMVARYKAPVFLAASTSDRLRPVTPTGTLSSTESATLDTIMGLGGAATAAQLATFAHLEAAAASNRLNALERRGYLWRVSRSRREGDVYVEPGTRVFQSGEPAASIDEEPSLALPPSVQASLAAMAKQVGRDAGDLLADAWRAYLKSHPDLLNARIAEARAHLSHEEASDDDPELAAWAAAAAKRARGG